MPDSVLSRLIAFQLIGRCRRVAHRVRDRRLAARIMAVPLAAVIASAAWAAGSLDKTHLQAKTATAPDLNADGSVPTAITKSGVQTRVGVAWDCALPDKIPVVWARADHGTVTILEGTGPQCGRPAVKLAGFFYTSEPGFKGTDKIYVMGFLVSGNINETYTVLVK